MRFVATADWHLGMAAGFLPPEAQARYQQARFDAVRAIGRLAAERDAAFVLVCGDVFESNHLDRRVLARTFEALRDFTVPVWLLPGNHDPLDAASIYDSERFRESCPEHVHVLRTPGIHRVLPGVEVVAAPWSSKRPLSDLVADACGSLQRCDGVIRIVAGHGAVDTLNPDRDDAANVGHAALRHSLDDGCVQMAILGDRHSTTPVAPDIWYPGSPEVTSRRDVDAGNALVVDIESEGGVVVEPVSTGRWQFRAEARHLTAADDVQRLRSWLLDLPDKERTAVWLSLRGTLSLTDSAALDSTLTEAGELFALVRTWERHSDLQVAPDAGDIARLGLTGFAERTLEELRATLARRPVAPDPKVGSAASQASGSDDHRPLPPTPVAALPHTDSDATDPEVAEAALGLLYRLSGGAR